MLCEKIMIVDDETTILHFLQNKLNTSCHSIVTSTGHEDVIKLVQTEDPSFLLLDIGLPFEDGFEICRRIREFSLVPIIILSGQKDDVDKALGLRLGADDYLEKPFSIVELKARIQAVLRRTKQSMPVVSTEEKKCRSTITIGNLSIDKDAYEVHKGGTKVQLTLNEFRLLHLLASNANQVLSRDQIYERLWGDVYLGNTKLVNVYIKKLRDIIEDEPQQYIETIRGVGYKFKGII